MTKPISSIKDRIAKGLVRADMKAIELANMTGIPKSTISLYLSGHSKPKSDRISSISKALNVSEAWLMGFDVSPERNTFSITLTDTESHLIDSFRKLDEEGQVEVIDYIDFKVLKIKSVLRDRPSTIITEAPFQVKAAHAHNPDSDGSELKGDFDMLQEAIKNDPLRKTHKKE